MPEAEPTPAAPERRRGPRVGLLAVAIPLVLVLGLLSLTLHLTYIPSGSMQRTLAIGDHVAYSSLAYELHGPRRGDVVLFDGAGTGFAQGLSGHHDFTKRVIGVGGDVVACPASAPGDYGSCDHVTVDGIALDESSYVFEDDHRVFGPITVPRGDVFLLGDHRSLSSDSRNNGPVPVRDVLGKAEVTYWPLGRWGRFSTPTTFHQSFHQP